MRLKIVGKPLDGSDITTCKGIKIINADTGEILDNVRKVSWECEVGGIAHATIELVGIECEIDGVYTKNEICTCEDFKKYNAHELTCPIHENYIKVVEKSALGDEFRSYTFVPGKLKKQVCPDCNGTEKIQGFLQEYECEKCKGTK